MSQALSKNFSENSFSVEKSFLRPSWSVKELDSYPLQLK